MQSQNIITFVNQGKSAMNPESEVETDVPTFSMVHVKVDPRFRNIDRYNYLVKLLGSSVLNTFDTQVIRGAVDGYYSGAAELYASDIARLARALYQRGAVLSWLGRGSHISQEIRKIKRNDE
jgi:hypothetical protein